jgi:hydroxymethylglutaryl-CoA lyase
MVKINESPREALQSSKKNIPTHQKIEYINSLLKVGFSVIDIGSFVSPNMVPQMSDTPEILKHITDKYSSEISILAGNYKFAEQIAAFDCVDYINYPFAISETFLKKNLNTNIENAFKTVEKIIDLCTIKNKKPNITISMAFGNRYDDDWGIDILMVWIEIFYEMGIRYFPLADTDGSGTDHLIGLAFQNLCNEYPDCEFNLHLHAPKDNALQKINSAWKAGCKNFDSVINGIGGCPMTGFEIIANLDTLLLINWLDSNLIDHSINKGFLNIAAKKAFEIF